MIESMIGSLNRVEVQRTVGKLRLTITVEEDASQDHAGRPLPSLRGTPMPMGWPDIGRRVNEIAHGFADEIIGRTADLYVDRELDPSGILEPANDA